MLCFELIQVTEWGEHLSNLTYRRMECCGRESRQPTKHHNSIKYWNRMLWVVVGKLSSYTSWGWYEDWGVINQMSINIWWDNFTHLAQGSIHNSQVSGSKSMVRFLLQHNIWNSSTSVVPRIVLYVPEKFNMLIYLHNLRFCFCVCAI